MRFVKATGRDEHECGCAGGEGAHLTPLVVLSSSFFSSFCTLMVRMSPSTFSLHLRRCCGQAQFGKGGCGWVQSLQTMPNPVCHSLSGQAS